MTTNKTITIMEITLIGFDRNFYDDSIKNLSFQMCEKLSYMDKEHVLKSSATNEMELEETYNNYVGNHIVRAFILKK